MLNWFKRKKYSSGDFAKVEFKPIDYPAKIILAWSKAIEGNDEILLWLKDNNYKELVMATYAIYLKDEARDWLVENGYTHLMAMINAAEGNESAQKWLIRNEFHLLYHIAMAVEGEIESFDWLGNNASADIFMLAKSIKKIKDEIEENHNDHHTFRKDI
jgi:hypothetical protein